MKPRDRKLLILRRLSQESEPITLSELLGKLQSEVTLRTVRRYLNQLVSEGLVEKSGQTKNAKYVVIKKKEGALQPANSCFSSLSLKVIKRINRPLIERFPIEYHEKWFEAYEPNDTYYIPKMLRKQLQAAGERNSDHDPAGTYAHKIFNRVLIDLSYNSSRLEGNTYSLLDTERLLLHGDSAEGKLDEEKIMILNHKDAIRYLVDNAPRDRSGTEGDFYPTLSPFRWSCRSKICRQGT